VGPRLTRREDWPLRLEAAIESARVQAFRWGEHDCVRFATGVVRDLTGCDMVAQTGLVWATRAEARRAERAAGGIAAAVTRVLGDPIAAALAQRGDLLLTCGPAGQSLGVCIGARGAFAGKKGLAFVPIAQCEQGWRVG